MKNRNLKRIGFVSVAALAICLIQPQQVVKTQKLKVEGGAFAVTTNADNGAGSLRQAITDANASAGADAITFSIGSGPSTISPLTSLPIITEPLIIDGSTQPGFSGTPLITISGGNVGGNGLQITGGASTVKSLILNGFANSLVLENNGGNIVTGCTIGSFGTGVTINNSPNNRIGGPILSERNFINNNSDHGIQIIGITSTANRIVGNYIGLAAEGVTVQRNFDTGVWISGAPGNFVGGALPGEGNVISGTRGGTSEISKNVLITGSTASGNAILGNTIGPRADGNASVQNRAHGIYIDGAPGTIIGGAEGTAPGGPCTGACNHIAGNFFDGITIIGVGADDTIIVATYNGTNRAGTAALNNGGASIKILDGATGTVIGGTTPEERNIVNNGIWLQGSSGTTVAGNFIGPDPTGNIAIGFPATGLGPGAGVLIDNSSANTINGNVISGNNGGGIAVRGPESFNNRVHSTRIGLSYSGNALQNNGDALFVSNGAHNNNFGIIPEPECVVPGDGFARITDDQTGNSIKFDLNQNDGPIQVEVRNGWLDATFTVGAELETVGNLRIAQGIAVYGLVDLSGGDAFGVIALDNTPEPYTSINDNYAFDLCTSFKPTLNFWNGGMVFGVPNEPNQIHDNSFVNNVVGWNATKTQDIWGSRGSALNLRSGFDWRIEKNLLTSGPNAVPENKPSVVLDSGTDNFFGRGEFSVRQTPAIPEKEVIDLATPGANRDIQPPSITSLAFDGNAFGVAVQVQGLAPGTPVLVELLTEETAEGEGGQKRKIVKSTGLEIRLTIDDSGLGFGFENFTGPEADYIRNGGKLLGKTTVVTFSDSPFSSEIAGQVEVLGDTSELSAPVAIPGVLISGRAVSQIGRGLKSAFVRLTDRFTGEVQTTYTNSFGYYRFFDVRPFRTYDLEVISKRHTFESQVLLLDDDLTDLVYISNQ